MSTLLFILATILIYLLIDAINVWYIKPYEQLKEDYLQLEDEHSSTLESYRSTVESLASIDVKVKQLTKRLAAAKGQITKLRKLYDKQDNTKTKK